MKPKSTAAKRKTLRPETFVAAQMRFDREGLAKIDRAAKLSGTTRSEFVRRTAVVEAERVLLDQVYFGVDRKTFDFFSELMTKPPSGPGYERLTNVKAPWDTSKQE